MKTRILFSLLSVSSFAFSQVGDWRWADSPSGSADNSGQTICTDATGNVYAAGFFLTPTITFGSYTLTNTDNSGATADMYIVKYTSNGGVIWAKSFGGNNFDDKALGICADGSGNFYFTGYFASQSISFGNFTLNRVGFSNIFTVKCNSSGTVIWAKTPGGGGGNHGNSISSDGLGHVYITGYFSALSMNFGTFTLTNSAGGTNYFLVKYDTSGTALWGRAVGGGNGEDARSVSADNIGNVYITGRTSSQNLTIGTFVYSVPSNVGDIFTVRYDSSGAVVWAAFAGGFASGDFGTSVSSDNIGNVYMTGYFNSDTLFYGTNYFLNAGGNNFFIMKYGSNGTVLWAATPGSRDNKGYSVSAETNGDVYVCGQFTRDSLVLGNITLYTPPSVQNPMFIAKYNSDNNVTVCADYLDNNNGYSTLTHYQYGYAYVTGSYQTTAMVVGSDTLGSTSNQNTFVAKWACPGSVGLSELGSDGHISIYPNPTRNTLNIECDLTIQNVAVSDLMGRILYSSSENTKTLDLSSYAPGIYFLRAQTSKGALVRKIVRE